MENTFLNMKQIMFAVGVKDKSQFARDFKRLTGLTPTEYTHTLSVQPKFQNEYFFKQMIKSAPEMFLHVEPTLGKKIALRHRRKTRDSIARFFELTLRNYQGV